MTFISRADSGRGTGVNRVPTPTRMSPLLDRTRGKTSQGVFAEYIYVSLLASRSLRGRGNRCASDLNSAFPVRNAVVEELNVKVLRTYHDNPKQNGTMSMIRTQWKGPDCIPPVIHEIRRFDGIHICKYPTLPVIDEETTSVNPPCVPAQSPFLRTVCTVRSSSGPHALADVALLRRFRG